MPFTYNGIGTMYYGRSNAEQAPGVCGHCNHEGMLSNYETKLWFTIIYIPVIPLGKKQILNECPMCERHYSLSPDEWQASQQAAVEETAEHLATNPNDPMSMVSMHATLVSCQREDEARDLLPMLESRFSDNVDVLMYLGSCHEEQGEQGRADEYFTRAWKLEPDNPRTRRAVGVGLLKKGQLNTARELFSALEPPSEHYDPAVWFLLGTAYQDHQRHEEALATFKLILAATPEIGKDKAFREVVRETEAALGHEKSCVRKDYFFHKKSFWLSLAASAVVAALIWGNSYIANNRKVHVVNGLKVPMKLVIDGNIHVKTKPGSFSKIRLSEGTHQVEITSPEEFAGEKEFSMSSGRLGRFFKDPAFVLDPTQSSIVLWEQTTYSKVPSIAVDPDQKSEVHLGQLLTYYDDVDFIFRRFPDSIEVEGGGKKLRTRVSMYRDSVVDVLENYGGELEHDDLLDFVERCLLASPRAADLPNYYLQIAAANDLDRAVAFFSAGLEKRPLRVAWHRAYQSVLGSQGKTDTLINRYDGYLEKEPNNSYLIYLRGRLEATTDKSMEYFRRATGKDMDNWFAWNGRAFTLMARANYGDALYAYERAIQFNPKYERLQESRNEARFALGHYGDIQRTLSERMRNDTFNLSLHLELLNALFASGSKHEAMELHKQYVARMEMSGFQGAEQYEAVSKLNLEYLRGDFAAWLESANKLGSPDVVPLYAFMAAIEMGNPQQATDILEEHALDPSPDWALALSFAWRQKGDPAAADKWAALAIDKLQQGGPTSAYAASLLSRSEEEPVTLNEALNIDLTPEEKVLIVLALAENANDREAMLDLAEKLNFHLDFPHHFVRRTIEAMRQ